jgi:hypothetical protein
VIPLAALSLFLSALPAAMYLRNRRLFAPPPAADSAVSPAVSVLIPARNEAAGIAACLRAVLASDHVTLEVIVLDDASTDGTADAARAVDPRVRVEPAPPLPPGWAGKQHACYTLSKLATHDLLVFLDADVRLTPDAIARLVAFRKSSGAALVSGFPRQETGTFAEKLLIPLINWLLVGYLPMAVMRRMTLPGLGAGCGQWFLTTREAYESVGGHGHPLVRASFHDGVKLPRAYRTVGRMTDLCDATDLATCRMYRSAGQVWRGLAKNAREGMAGPVGVWVWTLLLFGGHALPWLVLATALDKLDEVDRFERMTNNPLFGPMFAAVPGFAGVPDLATMIGIIRAEAQATAGLAVAGILLSVGVRLATARRYRASRLGAALHPVGVLLLLAVQWYAVVMSWVGRPVSWKDRPKPA